MHFRIRRADEKPDAGDGIRILVKYRPHHQSMSGALRHTMHLDRTRVFGLWDAMSPRKNFSNKIVEAEANPASSRRVKAPPLDGMDGRP